VKATVWGTSPDLLSQERMMYLGLSLKGRTIPPSPTRNLAAKLGGAGGTDFVTGSPGRQTSHQEGAKSTAPYATNQARASGKRSEKCRRREKKGASLPNKKRRVRSVSKNQKKAKNGPLLPKQPLLPQTRGEAQGRLYFLRTRNLCHSAGAEVVTSPKRGRYLERRSDREQQ